MPPETATGLDVIYRRRWVTANEKLFSVIFLTTTGAASFLIQRLEPKDGQPGTDGINRTSTNADGQGAWNGLLSKYQNTSKQRRRILMRRLDNMKMEQGQDPDVFMVQVHALKDELLTIGETTSTERLEDVVLTGITSRCARRPTRNPTSLLKK